MLNLPALIKSADAFRNGYPFSHCVIDGLFPRAHAMALERDFPAYESDAWHTYSNALEQKKTCNNWNAFPRETYRTLAYLNSPLFVSTIKMLFWIEAIADPGLNGGGLHIHGPGGRLNPHLDYSIHPKTGMQRRLNILVYLNSNWREEWGGHLGLYEQRRDARAPGRLVKEIAPLFNRAVIFDTTQDSWHGLSRPIVCPEGEYRKSLAVYYMTEAPAYAERRGKALFAPTREQESDEQVRLLIERRAQGEYV